MKLIIKNTMIDFDKVVRLTYELDIFDRNYSIWYTIGNGSYSIQNISENDFLKFMKVYKENCDDLFFIEEIEECEISKKDNEIADLKRKIKKLQDDFDGSLKITGSLDTRTLINIEERLKIIESQLCRIQDN